MSSEKQEEAQWDSRSGGCPTAKLDAQDLQTQLSPRNKAPTKNHLPTQTLSQELPLYTEPGASDAPVPGSVSGLLTDVQQHGKNYCLHSQYPHQKSVSQVPHLGKHKRSFYTCGDTQALMWCLQALRVVLPVSSNLQPGQMLWAYLSSPLSHRWPLPFAGLKTPLVCLSHT